MILPNDKPESMADAIETYERFKKQGELQDRRPSRMVAEKHFDLNVVLDKLVEILTSATNNSVTTQEAAAHALPH